MLTLALKTDARGAAEGINRDDTFVLGLLLALLFFAYYLDELIFFIVDAFSDELLEQAALATYLAINFYCFLRCYTFLVRTVSV